MIVLHHFSSLRVSRFRHWLTLAILTGLAVILTVLYLQVWLSGMWYLAGS